MCKVTFKGYIWKYKFMGIKIMSYSISICS